MRTPRPTCTETEVRKRPRLRSCSPATTSTSRPACCPAARRPGWRWPTLVVSGANVLLLDEPTNNLDPASREEVLGGAVAATRARSCWSPTTRARSRRCSPERVILLPDGVEDLWSADYADLVALA